MDGSQRRKLMSTAHAKHSWLRRLHSTAHARRQITTPIYEPMWIPKGQVTDSCMVSSQRKFPSITGKSHEEHAYVLQSAANMSHS